MLPQNSFKKGVVFNHASIHETLHEANIQALRISNNHITDNPNGIKITLSDLREENIAAFGVAENDQTARSSAIINDGISLI